MTSDNLHISWRAGNKRREIHGCIQTIIAKRALKHLAQFLVFLPPNFKLLKGKQKCKETFFPHFFFFLVLHCIYSWLRKRNKVPSQNIKTASTGYKDAGRLRETNVGSKLGFVSWFSFRKSCRTGTTSYCEQLLWGYNLTINNLIYTQDYICLDSLLLFTPKYFDTLLPWFSHIYFFFNR